MKITGRISSIERPRHVSGVTSTWVHFNILHHDNSVILYQAYINPDVEFPEVDKACEITYRIDTINGTGPRGTIREAQGKIICNFKCTK